MRILPRQTNLTAWDDVLKETKSVAESSLLEVVEKAFIGLLLVSL